MIWGLLALMLVIADRAVKYAATAAFAPDGVRSVLNGVFSLTYLENRGAAFGILQDARWFFVVVTLVAMAVLTLFLVRKRPKSAVMKLAASLIYAGAAGNLIDRIYQGYVVDMFRFDFIDFPVFNLADICVVCGAVLLCVYILFFYEKDVNEKDVNEKDVNGKEREEDA